MKVLFLTSVPFSEQHEISLNVKNISEKYDVEKWDLSQIYKTTANRNFISASDVKKIETIESFEEHLRDEVQRDNVLIVTDILLYNLKIIYSAIKKYPIDIVTINKEIMAGWIIQNGILSEKLRSSNLIPKMKAELKQSKLISGLISRLKCGNCKYDYVLASANIRPDAGKNFFQIHHVKYDEFLEEIKSEDLVDDKYILFIESGLTSHPMLKGKKGRLNEQVYLKQMNDYFDRLQEKTGMQVVVALHPKSVFEPGAFNDRLVFQGKTSQLIQHCEYIVSHGSTSFINAVLANKPIKVLTSYEIENSASNSIVAYGLGFAKLLDLEVVDLNHATLNDFVVNQNAYESFKQKYVINMDHRDKTNKELIVNFIDSLSEKAI